MRAFLCRLNYMDIFGRSTFGESAGCCEGLLARGGVEAFGKGVALAFICSVSFGGVIPSTRFIMPGSRSQYTMRESAMS